MYTPATIRSPFFDSDILSGDAPRTCANQSNISSDSSQSNSQLSVSWPEVLCLHGHHRAIPSHKGYQQLLVFFPHQIVECRWHRHVNFEG